MLEASILGRARAAGIVDVETVQIRYFATDKHHTVDDPPAGGGAGMVMRVDVVCAAMDDVRKRDPQTHVILLDARGKLFSQRRARALARLPHIAFVCGRYEGIDARVEHFVDEVISVGDFVLSGGEIAALAVFDAVVRLLPGALGNEASSVDESHTTGLLEHRQYTKPKSFRGHDIPDVFFSGNHAAIAKERRTDSVRLTVERRPDLWVRRRERAHEDSL